MQPNLRALSTVPGHKELQQTTRKTAAQGSTIRCNHENQIQRTINVYIYSAPGTQMSLALIGKDPLLEAKQTTNGFQIYHKYHIFSKLNN